MHSWISENAWDEDENQAANSRVSTNLATYVKMSKLQSGVCTIIANMINLQQDIEEVRVKFSEWDDDSNGYLEPNEIQAHTAEIALFFNLKEDEV